MCCSGPAVRRGGRRDVRSLPLAWLVQCDPVDAVVETLGCVVVAQPRETGGGCTRRLVELSHDHALVRRPPFSR
jgi:hypothetical protein